MRTAYEEQTGRVEPSQADTAKTREPLFRFTAHDSIEEIAAKLNHNLDLTVGVPAQTPRGTYTLETMEAYRGRKSREAIAQRDQDAFDEAERLRDPSYVPGSVKPNRSAYTSSSEGIGAAPPAFDL